MADLLRDRYEPIEVVGHGGEGRVLKALDRQHDRVVALKVRPVRDKADRDVLLSEARILLAIPPHPNLPLVREDFFEGDQYVIAMDWIEGTDLAKLVRARGHPGLAPSSVFRWLADAASALTHLHTLERPVVHGDVKPANLVLTSGGRVVLVDFGLSSAPDSPRRRAGTVGYAAPELTGGAPPTRASDIYSLAATAFELLVGEPPTGIRPMWEGFDADQASALEAAVRAGLATDPAKRVATAGELVERLRAGWGATLPTGVLTFCLTDIEGSTAHWSHEPAAMARALVRHDELVADVVEQHGGRFLKSMGEGDATVSAFVAATEAIKAMIALQGRLANDALGPDELRLRVRAALHTGEAEQRDGDYFGPTLNVAARIRGLAAGGEVYLSAATAALVGEHLPAGASLVELGPHRLRGAPDPEMVFALAAPGVVAPLPATVCPYPGLPAFEVDDAARFFGRDAVITDLVARLRASGFVALVGASGSGKSSVLRAGVAAQWGSLPVTVLTPEAGPDCLVEGDELVIVDQLEEVFTLGTDPDRQTRFLESIIARRGPVAVGIRADFYGRCAEHAGFAQAVAQHHVLLGPMNDDELRQAITGPAAAAGLRIERALVDILVAEVAGEPGAMPLLSHALRATWEHRDGRTLTLDAYRETGGLRSAVAATAEQVYESLGPEARGLARRTFLALTQPGEATDDSRRRATLAELTPAGGSAGLAPLLEGMAAARLLTVGDDIVEVAHEALIREWPRLRAWLDEDREGLRLHRHLAAAAAAWDGLGRDPAELYRGPRLAAAEEWAAARSDALSGIEAEFLDVSREERARAEGSRARATRRLRSLLAGVIVALVVALVAATLAVGQQRRASHARDRADVARIAAVSRGVVERQPDVGLLLAVLAHDLDDTADTLGTLLNALETHPLLERLVYGVDSQLEAAVLSPDGRLLVTPTSDGTGTILWDTSTGRRTATLQHENDFSLSAAISPDGRWLAVPAIYPTPDELPAGRLEVWDLRTRELHAVVESPAGALSTAAFTADGSRLFTQGGPSDRAEPPDVVVIWDTGTWQPVGDPWVLAPTYSGDEALTVSRDGSLVALRMPDDVTRVGVWGVRDRSPVGSPIFVGESRDIGPVTALAFSPDGQTLAIATDAGLIFFVDPLTGAARRSRLELPESAATTMEFSSDAATLAVGRVDGRTQMYAVRAGEPLGPPLAASAASIVDVSFSADGLRLVTTGSDRIGALWRLDGHRPIGTPLADQEAAVTEARFTPDGNHVVTAAIDGKVTVRDAAGRVERSVSVPGEALSVDVDPSGRRLVASGTGGSVVLVDLDGANRVDIPVEDAWVQQVAFSPDGKTVALAMDHTATQPAAGLGSGELRFVDARTGKSSRESIIHDESFWGVAYAPDGKTVAAIAQNNLLHFFGAPSGRRLDPPIEVVDSAITSVAYSPDGRRVVLGIASGVVRTYDATTHKPAGAEFDADDAGVYGVAISPDGTLVAGTSLGLSTARLWATATGTPLGGRLTGGRVPYTYRSFTIEHFMAARPDFSPDGRRLVTPGFPGASIIWDLDAAHWRQAACAMAGRDLTSEEWRRYLPDRTPHRVCPG
jgi:WD40 repeat protein/class 3 adenylate cyclase